MSEPLASLFFLIFLFFSFVIERDSMIAVDSIRDITIDDRLRGAVWGQFIGDAAALGTHWIYDLDEISSKFPRGVIGFETPMEGHYHFGKKSGDQTHYGDGALVLLESIASNGGFDARTFGQAFVRTFDPGIYRGYLDNATKGTLENFDSFRATNPDQEFDFQQGADDDQLAAASRIASLVVRYWRNSELLDIVRTATRVCQDNERTVAYIQFHALLLLELLRGEDVHTALEQAQKEFMRVDQKFWPEIRYKSQGALEETLNDVTEATQTFGQACPLEQSFPSALHAFLKHADDFETCILATIRAGGDNAGRAAMLGSWLGAHLGIQAIPREWRNRLTAAPRINAALERILLDLSR
jgi:ADP-ribosylglycohydrolase